MLEFKATRSYDGNSVVIQVLEVPVREHAFPRDLRALDCRSGALHRPQRLGGSRLSVTLRLGGSRLSVTLSLGRSRLSVTLTLGRSHLSDLIPPPVGCLQAWISPYLWGNCRVVLASGIATSRCWGCSGSKSETVVCRGRGLELPPPRPTHTREDLVMACSRRHSPDRRCRQEALSPLIRIPGLSSSLKE